MQVVIKLGHESMLVEITGAEMETFARVMSKATRVEFNHIGDTEYAVVKDGGKTDWTIRVVANTPTITGAQYEIMVEAAQKADRAKMVAGIIAGTDTGNNLKDQLWYRSVITREQRDAASIDTRNDEGVIYEVEPGNFLTVYVNGDYSWNHD